MRLTTIVVGITMSLLLLALPAAASDYTPYFWSASRYCYGNRGTSM
jgi:hypothetical protein